MNINELLEAISMHKGQLQFLQGINPCCKNCDQFNEGVCKEYGQVPTDFVKVGCDNWIFDDIQF